MLPFKFLILLILLLILENYVTKSTNVHTQRQSSFEDDENAQLPHLDQIAQSSTWKSQNHAVSATYSGDQQTDHSNLVINVKPRPNYKPADVDVYASQTLSNARTAEEYVNKALEMKQKYEYTTPSSSYVKYDIFEGEKTKRMPVQRHEIQSEPMQPQREPIAPKEDITDMSVSEYSEFTHHPEYVAQTATTTTYKHPEYNTSYKDLEQPNSDYKPQFMSNYDSFDSIGNINYDNPHSYRNALRKLSGYPSKEEMIRYIEKAVKKYLREMNLGGKLYSSLNSAPSAHAEIETYHRFPSSTTPSPLFSEPTKLYSAGTHSEFFKTGKNSYKQLYGTIKPFTVETYNPEGVDLTVRSKKRPKPIDLSALDVGQSWSHTNTLTNPDPIPYRNPKKQKIHINTQTYHDINALPYVPNRGLVHEYSTATAHLDHSSGHHHSSYKDHPVVASISFGEQPYGNHHGSYGSNDEPLASHKPHFVPSMQVVNGVPVKNPYKFSMDTLSDIFGNNGERSKYPFHNSDHGSSNAPNENPYNLDLTPTTTHDNTRSTSSYIYEAYTPKYNNNPEEQYYTDNNYQLRDWDGEYSIRQRGSTGHEMYSNTSNSGGSPSRSKKVAAVHSSTSKRAISKVKAKSKTRTLKRSQQQSRELDRNLTPPPAKQR